ncbi:Transducin/WD40 repeat-like superfamily protein [Raphanus sativus]|nr:Transducin/WD40 repeat-like superfamily protein [Raphanus sativus]
MRVVSWLFDSEHSSRRRRRTPKSPTHLDSADSATSSSLAGSTSLHSSLSLQTLPSVPSLQKIPSETLAVAVSHSVTSSFKLRERSLPVTCLAVNGGYLFAVSGHEVSIYDRAMCAHLDAFNGQDPFSGSVKSIGFCGEKIFTAHQDGKIGNGFIYSVSWDKTLKIWRASDLRCQESVKAHDDAVNAVAVSTNGTVYTGSADRRIRVWAKPADSKRHKLVATLEKHKSAVNALALSEDGSVLFSGSCDRSILVWEREDSSNYMAVSGALRGHDKAILSLFNVSDLLISGSADRTVRIWRRGTDGSYSCLEVLSGHTKPVKSLAAVKDRS